MAAADRSTKRLGGRRLSRISLGVESCATPPEYSSRCVLRKSVLQHLSLPFLYPVMRDADCRSGFECLWHYRPCRVLDRGDCRDDWIHVAHCGRTAQVRRIAEYGACTARQSAT